MPPPSSDALVPRRLIPLEVSDVLVQGSKECCFLADLVST